MIDDEPDLEPDVAIGGRPRAPGRRMLAQLDRALNRIRRKKGGGKTWFWLKLALGALVLGPIAWVLLYRIVDAPVTLLMMQRSFGGETITHRPVKLADMSPHLVRAVIAAEDAKFCRHHGFDMDAIDAAMKANRRAAARGKPQLRGGSTISQQTAKNLFLWPSRDWVRKGAEAYFTVLTERLWPKRKILEQYLNAVEWGDGNFGADAAAHAYFGKSAKNLTPDEAARLAAVLPSPNKWSVVHPGPYVRARAATIAARAWVLKDQGLDLCVLNADAPAPPRPAGELPTPELTPMPEPPPTIVDEDQPVAQAGPLPDEPQDLSSNPTPVSPEAPREPEQPADAPTMGKHAPLAVEPPPASSAAPALPPPAATQPANSPGPLNIAP